MLFRDFLRAAVMLHGAAASVLAVVSIAAGVDEETNAPIYFAAGWWVAAVLVGLWLGRRNAPTAQIGRLLGSARATNTLPELQPGAIVFNRLWPLIVMAVLSTAAGLVIPQVPAIATGYAIVIALTWRKQPTAVEAIEGRDGVRFYFERSSPFGEPRLLRTPGLRKIAPAEDSPAATSR